MVYGFKTCEKFYNFLSSQKWTAMFYSWIRPLTWVPFKRLNDFNNQEVKADYINMFSIGYR